MDKNELKKNVKSLAARIAHQIHEESGKEYSQCISEGLDEACERLGIDRKTYIKLFI